MPRIVLGLSGGVDSALAAALLQERGLNVVGCFLKVDLTAHGSRLTACPWKDDLPMAHRVAAHLNVPLVVKDVSTEYEREVLEPMVAAYRAGETPNPDILCNRWVKFDALAAVAREVGSDRIATGHYARVKKVVSPSRWEGERPATRSFSEGGGGEGIIELYRGIDHTKDQSYFLATLTSEQLSQCEFPLGEWRKDDVRTEANRRGLPNWNRDSTSGVCFLGHVNLAEFLARFPSPSYREGEGEQLGERSSTTVVTTTGEVIGTIPSAEALTIGQRAPIAGQSAPRYVVAQEVSISPTLSVGEARRVVVSATSEDPARFVRTFTTSTPHWIGAAPHLPFIGSTVRIRHRQEPQPCVVSLRGTERRLCPSVAPTCRGEGGSNPGLHVQLATPLTGVAPGQVAVFTDGDRILGGAAIT